MQGSVGCGKGGRSRRGLPARSGFRRTEIVQGSGHIVGEGPMVGVAGMGVTVGSGVSVGPPGVSVGLGFVVGVTDADGVTDGVTLVAGVALGVPVPGPGNVPVGVLVPPGPGVSDAGGAGVVETGVAVTSFGVSVGQGVGLGGWVTMLVGKGAKVAVKPIVGNGVTGCSVAVDWAGPG